MRKKLLLAQVIFLLLSTLTFAQNTTLTGKVTEEGGVPIVGAVVAVKGGKQATTTDVQGNYSLSVPPGATVVVSYVGYTTRELAVRGASLNITISKQDKALDEIVVTALGIKKEKKALSSSVTEIKGSELTEARTPNIANSLEGKVAGLNIVSTATGPAGASRLTLRGNGSISGNNQPLIVVDGIPIDNDQMNFTTGTNNSAVSSVGMWAGTDQGDGISSLNPDEIESISVLKGGTAAALYGSRASNGAILVTTKGGGKAGAGMGVEVGSNFVVEDLLYKKFKDYQYEYGIGDHGLAPTTSGGGEQTDSYGAKLDGSSVIQYDGVSRPYVAHKNNLSEFYNVGNSFTNSVALTGANDRTSYRFSASDLNYHGVLPNNTLRRDNFAFNINSKITDRLSITANAKYIREKNHDRPVLSDSPGNANYSMNTLGTSLDVKTLKLHEVYPQGSVTPPAGYEWVYTNNQYVTNPYFATEKFIQDDQKDRIIASATPRFNITDWLNVQAQLGFDRFNFTNTNIMPTGTGFQFGGNYSHNLATFDESNVGATLNLDKKIGKKLALTALVGVNKMSRSIIQDNINGNNTAYNIPYFYQVSNVNAAGIGVSHGDIEKRINSTFGSAELSYNNYLFLNVTGREDWFSALTPPDGTPGVVKNHIFYPSVGLSFVLSDAVKMPAYVNYAKVRASWAQVGGDLDPYQLALNYSLSGSNGASPLAQINGSQVPNSHLQPYRSISDEIGVESHMFNNRLTLDLTYYNHNNSKDIVSATIPPVSGYQQAVFNVGKITNKGVEVLINYKVIDNKNFTWTPGVNFSYNKSEVVALYGDLKQLTVANPRSQTVNIVDEIGKPYAEVQALAYVRNPAGQIVYNATGLPNSTNLFKDMGTGVSPWVGGVTNSFRYKRFTLDILVDGKFGGVIYSGTNALAYRYGLSKETLVGRVGGVVGKGVQLDGQTPNTVNVEATAYYQNLYNFGEPFVYSSNFIKLRSLTLDYSLPVKSWGKTPFKAATVSIVGRNLWTIMKKTPNIDPESTYNNGNAQGLEFTGMPITRTMGVNVNLKF